MEEGKTMKKCNKECFGNQKDLCMVLSEVPEGECRFQRTDITLEQQMKEAKDYSSQKSTKNER